MKQGGHMENITEWKDREKALLDDPEGCKIFEYLLENIERNQKIKLVEVPEEIIPQ